MPQCLQCVLRTVALNSMNVSLLRFVYVTQERTLERITRNKDDCSLRLTRDHWTSLRVRRPRTPITESSYEQSLSLSLSLSPDPALAATIAHIPFLEPGQEWSLFLSIRPVA